jgi:polyferredoxin
MAICSDCKQEMKTAKSCIMPEVLIDSKWYKRNTKYFDRNDRCHDCGY